MLAQQGVSFGRMAVVLAAVVVVLAGMHIAAPVLNPILFAVVFALIFAPVYAWLRRRLPTVLTLLVMLVGLGVLPLRGALRPAERVYKPLHGEIGRAHV